MSLNRQLPVYSCLNRDISSFPTYNHEFWNDLPIMNLLETNTGEKVQLTTHVQCFWTAKSLFFRFICRDNYVLATMTNHDDPIYEEDVVEVFISETGSLKEYKEFELSPANVKFDTLVKNDLLGSIQLFKEWDAVGWNTSVHEDAAGLNFTYIWEIPFINFTGGTPAEGDEWRMNCYRIDRGLNNSDLFMAWSPTGEPNFHVPQSFGFLRFIK
jgi:hypothetical protein